MRQYTIPHTSPEFGFFGRPGQPGLTAGDPSILGQVPKIAVSRRQRGLTYVELMVALVIAAILLLGLDGVVGRALQSHNLTRERNDLVRQSRFAMQRMVRAARHTRLLLLPLADKPASNWPENIREQSVPAEPPIGDSTRATAVLALSLPVYSDMDGDGFPDADDDRDGRVDEDLPSDVHADGVPGIYLIDDNGDGRVDEGFFNHDDDESFFGFNEDPIDGVDNDGDNNLDEDPSTDINGDGCPGICGVDDDGDGQVDEGEVGDDDEDGQQSEDWYNPIVFYLDGGTLKERVPVPWDTGGDGRDGRDFVTSDIAVNVTRFRVERIPRHGDRDLRLDITLELSGPLSGETVVLQTQVRVGGAL